MGGLRRMRVNTAALGPYTTRRGMRRADKRSASAVTNREAVQS